MFELTGKAALVTGATGGIGGAIAKALHAQGARVMLAGTRTAVLDALAAELGERAFVATANLADAGAADDLIRRAEAEMGQLDILVNNAGFARDGLALRMKDEDWASVLDVNLGAAFRLSRAALKGMMRRRSGRIISITSVVGTSGNPGQANYAASKAGLVGLSKSLAGEVATRGITVNCIAPGFIDTAMTEALTVAQKERISATIPIGRMGTPEEIATAVVYLASNEAAYVTGQTLHINGGMLMV
jgi:3-oxoacyl-[acyl-carrier protein] reductase